MHRSSESIASLAAALAKAQQELENPQKSLIGSIRSEGTDSAERLFRYASLSSGLEIVRKTLGQHEIATVQTTTIDQTAGIVSLTTMLAHSSGEWIASDWPVCAIADTAEPHRIGAALTYARRYALFTLVGIAGEDDLDAPNLATPTQQTSGSEKPKIDGNGLFNGVLRNPAGRKPVRRHGANTTSAEPMLSTDASAELRDRLLAELKDLDSGDGAALWAQRSLIQKNRLTAADAQCIEEDFQARLAALVNNVADEPAEKADALAERTEPPSRGSAKPKKPRRRSKGIDKSLLALPEPRRIRDRDHVRYVAKQPCLICGRCPSDAHHLRFMQSRALGRKVSDEFTVPLCRGHHREVHRSGDEAIWWQTSVIDPTLAARALWLQTHPLPSAPDQFLAAAVAATTGRETPKCTRLSNGRKSNLKPTPGGDPVHKGVA
jgi:hypothetical protein